MRALSQYENLSVKKIAELFGCGEDRVYDMLSLFDMPKDLRDAVEVGELTLIKAVVVSRFPDSERSEILGRVLREGGSVKWLRQELAHLKRHPLYNRHWVGGGPPLLRRHALLAPITLGFMEGRGAYWELIGRQFGIPSPMKCEFTMLRFASECVPP